MTMNFLLFVTGASRGFGRAASIAFVKGIITNRAPKSKHAAQEESKSSPMSGDIDIRAVLISRNEEGMEETARLMHEELSQLQQEQKEVTNISLNISCHCIDLQDVESLEDHTEKILSRVVEQTTFYHTVLINNAGSLGSLDLIAPTSNTTDVDNPDQQSTQLSSLQSLRRYIDFNITSNAWLSSRFAQCFIVKNPSCYCTVVNISSVTGIRPFPTMSMYCTGKASREMFHSVLAAELSPSSSTSTTNAKVLNYAPGHTETDMQVELRSSLTLNKNVQNFLRQLKEKGELVDPNDAADHLAGLVLSGGFKSGERVDYLEVMKNKEES